MAKTLLKDLVFARSGDKGDVCNIGLMAKTRNIYDFLLDTLTAESIKEHFKGMVKGDVIIYPMPNINSVDVVLNRSLGGGATCTLRFDQTGKSMCSALQRMEVDADESLIKEAMEADEAIMKKYTV